MQVLSFRDMFNFDFSEKCSGIVSPHPFAYDFSKKKMFLMLYSTNWPNFVA